ASSARLVIVPPMRARVLLLLGLVSAGCINRFAPRGPLYGGDLETRIARIEGSLGGARLGERMAYYHVPAVSVALIDRGAIAWTRAWGLADAKLGTPATPETLFQAASVSKALAAVAMLR